jgi:DNA-binding GntR family transcriptional regulator
MVETLKDPVTLSPRSRPSAVRKSAIGAEDIASQISTAIAEHRLPPGTKLTEESLGEIFGVSRTKVREALYAVARSKLVTWLPGRTAYVSQPSVEEARDLFETRRVLEATTIRRLAKSVTSQQLAQLRAQVAREKKALSAKNLRTGTGSGTRFLGEFHFLIAELAGNKVLEELVREISARTSLVEIYYGTLMPASCSCEEHRNLLACIERGDGEEAAKLMAKHIDHIEGSLNLHQAAQDTFDLRAAFPSITDRSASAAL